MSESPVDPRFVSLMEREFHTIKLMRDPELRSTIADKGAEASVRNARNSSGFLFVLDRVCAEYYSGLAAAYLAKITQRVGELGMPWTAELRTVVLALLHRQLINDWNWLIGVRNHEAGQRQGVATGLLSHAQTIAERLNEEEIDARVLRQDSRRLPLLDLLSAPRYSSVLRHLLNARESAVNAHELGGDVAREAIHAVESLARVILQEPTKTLGECLGLLMARADPPGRLLLTSVDKVWAFCNQAPSVRHGGGAGDPVNTPEAQYVLSVAEAAIRMLLVQDMT